RRLSRLISLQKRMEQVASVVEHGSLCRVLSILWERFRQGYSQRSLTDSWPKRIELKIADGLERCRWFFLTHLLSDHSYAGLQTLLEIAKRNLENGKKLKFVLTDFTGSLDNFYKAVAADKAKTELWSGQIDFIDASNEKLLRLSCSKDDEFFVSAWWTMSA